MIKLYLVGAIVIAGLWAFIGSLYLPVPWGVQVGCAMTAWISTNVACAAVIFHVPSQRKQAEK